MPEFEIEGRREPSVGNRRQRLIHEKEQANKIEQSKVDWQEAFCDAKQTDLTIW